MGQKFDKIVKRVEYKRVLEDFLLLRDKRKDIMRSTDGQYLSLKNDIHHRKKR